MRHYLRTKVVDQFECYSYFNARVLGKQRTSASHFRKLQIRLISYLSLQYFVCRPTHFLIQTSCPLVGLLCKTSNGCPAEHIS
jgi:hypothetical protein